MDITIQLQRKEVEYIIQLLSQRPYIEVKELLEGILKQANSQVEPPKEVPPNPSLGAVN